MWLNRLLRFISDALIGLFSTRRPEIAVITIPAGIPAKPRILSEKWLLDANKAPEYLMVHHSGASDHKDLDNWAEIDIYHRSFRIDYNIFASPVTFSPKDGYVLGEHHSGYMQYKSSWYEESKVQEWLKLAGNPNITNGFDKVVKGKYFQAAWRAIGYNCGSEYSNGNLIIRYGRSLRDHGAHCSQEKMNSRSIGHCIIGNYDKAAPSQNIWDFAIQVGRDVKIVYPQIKILGHHEVKGVPPKTCPGVYFDMDLFRKEVG